MELPGVWLTESESVVYRVVPKCACSTIGQILYYSDHGQFYEGDIHDAEQGMYRWSYKNKDNQGQTEINAKIEDNVRNHRSLTFTCVRNPYTRILSSFFDKICAVQRDGNYYRGDMVDMIVQKYGIEIGSPDDGFQFDQIKSFRRFLLFARDTIRWGKPIPRDVHWSPTYMQVRYFIVRAGRCDKIFWTEKFNDGMRDVLDSIETKYPIDLDQIPRFNESEGHGPKRAHPVEDYFDDLSMHLIYEIYGKEFELFKYDRDNPANPMPVGEIDLDEVHAKLGK